VTGIPDFAHRSAADIGRPVANRFHIVGERFTNHRLMTRGRTAEGCDSS
jgi:hypothetical protein